MKFPTEDFLSAVIADIKKSHKVDPSHIYTLSWSSSGPVAYASSLAVEEIKGSLIAYMLKRAKPAILGFHSASTLILA